MVRRFSRKSSKKVVREWRMTMLIIVIFLFAAAIIFRLFVLQVVQGGFYIALASDQHKIYKNLFPERGKIFLQDTRQDNGEYFEFATNKEMHLIYAVPHKIKDAEKAVEQLGEIFEFNDEEIEDLTARLSREGDPYEPIKHFATDEEVQKLEEAEIVGITSVAETVRYYPEGSMGSHVLGFYGLSGDSQERVGQYGLEGYFNEELKGERGSLKTEGDIAGRLISFSEREMVKARDGNDLVLTLDHTIQYVVCSKLKAAVLKHGADAGSVVVIDPKTGGLLAMCSYPDFDPNNYREVDDISIYNNPAIFDLYEPGSIFKPITMAAALDLGVVTPETTYEDTGVEQISGYTIQNSDFKAYGQQSMIEVLEKSLNTGAIFTARQVGIENLYKYVRNFGFGYQAGIELHMENNGNINSLRLSDEIYLATASFGQGISVTPLQLTAAYAAVANKGKLMKPYIVDKIIDQDGNITKNEPKEVRQVISEKAATLLSGMLVSVVQRGHGTRAGVPGYFVGGKTGTAQVPKKDGPGYEEDITIGSFAGFAPVEDPKFAMLVKIDRPRDVQWAESSAAPLFGEIAALLLDYYKIPPTAPVE